MNKKSTYLIYILIGLGTFLLILLIYLQATKTINHKTKEHKQVLVQFIGLPDLAIATETTSVRHRSLADLFSIYRDDPDLREYFPSTFVYSHSHIINKESSIEP
jgi:hypothetical protein